MFSIRAPALEIVSIVIIAARPKRLIGAPYNQFVATRILDTELRPGTADNDINALRTNGTIPDGYSVNHFLTTTNKKFWFVMTDVPNGMKHFQRTPLQTGMDGDFDTGNVRYKARERYSFGVSDFLGIFGSGNITLPIGFARFVAVGGGPSGPRPVFFQPNGLF